MNTADRFWSNVDRGEGCWEWRTKATGKRYATFGEAGRDWLAHRFSYQLANGPIPAGMHVLHRCDNGWCVRPDHLFLGTHADNMADMAAKGRGRSGHQKHDACPYGHLLSGPNLYVAPNGMRSCRECVRRRGAEYRARRRSPECHRLATA